MSDIIERAFKALQPAFRGLTPGGEAAAKSLLAELYAAGRREALRDANRRAEADMIKGRPITGAHSRAIEALLREAEADRDAAREQQGLGWQRAAEKDRAYQAALDERDRAERQCAEAERFANEEGKRGDKAEAERDAAAAELADLQVAYQREIRRRIKADGHGQEEAK